MFLALFEANNKLCNMNTRPTMQELLEDICAVHGEDAEYVRTSNSTAQTVVRCKRLFCYIGYMLLRYKTIEIAPFLGYKQHGSVCYHSERVRTWIRLNDGSFLDDWYEYKQKSKLWPFVKEYKIAA